MYGASLIAHLVNHLPAMQETRVQFLGQEDPLEKEMSTHSSILAWRIPWTEEPSGLQSTGSQRVGHDCHFHFHYVWEDRSIWTYWNHFFHMHLAIWGQSFFLDCSHPNPRGRQRTRGLNGIAISMEMILSKLQMVREWETWHVTVHGSQKLDKSEWVNNKHRDISPSYPDFWMDEGAHWLLSHTLYESVYSRNKVWAKMADGSLSHHCPPPHPHAPTSPSSSAVTK